MSAEGIDGGVDTVLEHAGGGVGNRPLIGRKSVLMGMLASGFVLANAAEPSASAATIAPGYTPTWTPSTTYQLKQQVISPNNDVVSANATHTSSAAYATDTAKWKLSATFAGKPSATDVTFIVSPRGSDANDGLTQLSAKATISGALTAAGGVACTLLLAAGDHILPVGVALASGTVIRGAGTGLTFVTYKGTGTAFTTNTPGVRSFALDLSNFRLIGPGHTVASSTGIDLDSVSMAHLHDLYVEAFGKGVRVRSVIDGGAVYNRITTSTLINCGIGLSVEALSSNATTVDRCRACACDIGVKILDSNDTTLNACQVEANTVGVHVEASAVAYADYNAVNHCRFEGNTTAWEITANVRDTIVAFPHIFGTYTVSNLGTRTVMTLGAKQARPTTLAGVIAAGTALGLWA
jgi:hypothetical protein